MQNSKPTILICNLSNFKSHEIANSFTQKGFNVELCNVITEIANNKINNHSQAIFIVCNCESEILAEILRIRKAQNRNHILAIWSVLECRLSCLELLKYGIDECFNYSANLEECSLRIQRLIQFVSPVNRSEIVKFGKCWVNFSSYELFGINGITKVSNKELKILKLLTQNKSELVTKNQIWQVVWELPISTINTRSIDTHIYMLRKKIEPDPLNPKHIITVIGLGYVFQTDIL